MLSAKWPVFSRKPVRRWIPTRSPPPPPRHTGKDGRCREPSVAIRKSTIFPRGLLGALICVPRDPECGMLSEEAAEMAWVALAARISGCVDSAPFLKRGPEALMASGKAGSAGMIGMNGGRETLFLEAEEVPLRIGVLGNGSPFPGRDPIVRPDLPEIRTDRIVP